MMNPLFRDGSGVLRGSGRSPAAATPTANKPPCLLPPAGSADKQALRERTVPVYLESICGWRSAVLTPSRSGEEE